MEIYKPPSFIQDLNFKKSIFLAGSIENGVADDWQKRFENEFKDVKGIILNPRRDEWDSSWEQSIDNPHFKSQVQWELYSLERSTLVVMYFDPNTKSQISLLELGLHLKSDKVIVCCPKGYIKKGNVDVTCDFYRVPVYETFEELVETVRLIVT